MRVADYIAQRLQYLGCTDVFMVTGGAAMHLNDAFGRVFSSRTHCLHHEQSCAMAAESFSRIAGIPAIINVTAGPGAINAINGVFGAYVDSLPAVVVSGQAKRETMLSSCPDLQLRQLGDQEVDIIRMVSGICKQSVLVQDPLNIAEILDDCYLTSISGRRGPVWLDVPIDVQSTVLPPEFDEKVNYNDYHCAQNPADSYPVASDEELEVLAASLLSRKRPVLYVGSAIRINPIYDEFLSFLDEWPISVVTAWNSNDLLWDNHPCYSGRPGSVGNRAGNFAVQFSECVVVLGCRLNIRLTSYNWSSFAKNAWRCHVDIDKAELDKPTLQTDLKINAALQGFFPRLSAQMHRLSNNRDDRKQVISHWRQWVSFSRQNLTDYCPVKTALPVKPSCVNPYRLISQISKLLKQSDVVVCADGTACVVGFQAAEIKPNQRWYHNSGCASMGYELPAAIGAHYASGKLITCIAGDGSIMMNLQELAYIGGNSLPIKIFILNNYGYHSIRQTQRNYFPDNQVGCGQESGLPFPDFGKLAPGFGINHISLKGEDQLVSTLDQAYLDSQPLIVEVFVDLEQDFSPKLASKKLPDGQMVTAELEDMTPLLGEDQLDKIRLRALSIC